MLERALTVLPPFDDPRLLAGTKWSEDAAVYRLSDEQALVATVDFFTPIVDDPYIYGRIAAVNSLSDIYAMGGKPFLALNVVGFPSDTLDIGVLNAVLKGGADACKQEGVLLAGGHTMRCPELYYGLSVLGFADPRRLVTNGGAHPGDALVLTKALGTGIVATAVKTGDCPAEVARAAEASMLASNGGAAAEMVAAGATCATDVTGFGLLGHGLEVARASGVTLRFFARRVPALPGALALAGRYAPGGLNENLRFVKDELAAADVSREVLNLLADPQTSGGLLVALPPAKAVAFARAVGAPAAVVGEVIRGDRPGVEVVN